MSNIRNIKIEKKFSYAIRALEERLLKERNLLINIFQRPTKYKEWQKDNIENSLYRISQLEKGIEDLKTFETINLIKLLKK